MKKLRVGVIGLGIGSLHLLYYSRHPGVELVAVADMNEERRKKAVADHGIPQTFSCAETMLREVPLDLVSICTPNILHKPLTIAALEAGVHVLCEKPMAMNAQEAREMLEVARRVGRRLMINFSFRFKPQSIALKQQVDAGTFGEIYFGRSVWHRRRGMPGFGGWFGTKALSGGGPLIDLGVHRLDLALWLMGYPRPTWVLGATYDPIARDLAARSGKAYDVEDLAAACIRFENGATLMLEASWAANIKEKEQMETTLLGTKAGLRQRNLDEGYELETEIFNESNGALFDMKLHQPLVEESTSMDHFVDAILHDTPHIATGEEGLIVMELLDAIYESAATGAPVRIGDA